MDKILSPKTPILSLDDLTALAPYAKHLGKARHKQHRLSYTGSHRQRIKGHGMEMLELRQYQAHDEFRHIDWRVTARTGEAHTRLYAQEAEHQRQLWVDISPSGYFGTQHTFLSTRLVQVAALITWRTHYLKDALGYAINHQQYHQHTKICHQHDLQKWLNHLAVATTFSQRENTGYINLWQRKSPKIVKQDILILSDQNQITPNDLSVLNQLARHNTIHWVKITDQKMFEIPNGQYLLADMQGMHSLQVSSKSKQQTQGLIQRMQALMQNQLSQIGIQLHHYDLHESPVDITRDLLALGVLR